MLSQRTVRIFLLAGIAVTLFACRREAERPTAATKSAPAAATKGFPVPARPPIGRSIHIGVSEVSLAHYATKAPLSGPAADAHRMQEIAQARGFVSTGADLLIDAEATTSKLVNLLHTEAASLQAGDTLLITYSGHGCLLPDGNGDERSGYDAAWCLYDRAFVDDEFDQLLGRFRDGVHILVVSDSCHSGTMLTFEPPPPLNVAQATTRGPYALVTSIVQQPTLRIKQLALNVEMDMYHQHKALYDGIQHSIPKPDPTKIAASVVLLAACQDDQVTADGSPYSAFTARLLDVWNDGRFTGSLQQFYDALDANSSPATKPNLYVVGKDDHVLQARQPFTH